MVDISEKWIDKLKPTTDVEWDAQSLIRSASAEAMVSVPSEVQRILEASNKRAEKQQPSYICPKGEVFQIARIAGIQAAKKTSAIIPLCHQVR